MGFDIWDKTHIIGVVGVAEVAAPELRELKQWKTKTRTT